MPNIKSAAKRMRQDETRYRENLKVKRQMRRAIKDTMDCIAANQEKEARGYAQTAQKMIDKAVKKGVIKKNTASRKKSQLMRRVEEAFGTRKTGSTAAAGKSTTGSNKKSGTSASGKSGSRSTSASTTQQSSSSKQSSK